MIYTQGFMPPSEVMYALISKARDDGIIDGSTSGRDIVKTGCQEFWKFTETLEHGYLLAPNGSTFLVGSRVFQVKDKSRIFGAYFSISRGILQAAGPRTLGDPMSTLQKLFSPRKVLRTALDYRFNRDYEEIVAQSFGAFYGMAIVFEKKQLSDYLAAPLQEEVRDLRTEKAVADLLVEAFDRGALTTKSEAKHIYGGQLGARAFGRAWSRASELRPRLSAPGRKTLLEE